MKKHYHSNLIIMVGILLLLSVTLYYRYMGKQENRHSDINQQHTSNYSTQVPPTVTEKISMPQEGTVTKSPENTTQNEETPSSMPVLSDEAFTLSREDLHQLPSGTIIDITNTGDEIMKNGFYYEEITDDVMSRIKGKSYGKDCTVPLKDLRYARVLYYGFDKETHIGELIVNTAIADDIIDIFAELYEAKYPIEQMVLIDKYDADDNASMAADNTSSFNYRLVPGSNHLSKHALGLAIDINPLYNPYVQYNEDGTVILPEEGIPYADRTLDCPYYINKEDLCYQAFTSRGFTWGGSWDSEPDYQHFQKTKN